MSQRAVRSGFGTSRVASAVAFLAPIQCVVREVSVGYPPTGGLVPILTWQVVQGLPAIAMNHPVVEGAPFAWGATASRILSSPSPAAPRSLLEPLAATEGVLLGSLAGLLRRGVLFSVAVGHVGRTAAHPRQPPGAMPSARRPRRCRRHARTVQHLMSSGRCTGSTTDL